MFAASRPKSPDLATHSARVNRLTVLSKRRDALSSSSASPTGHRTAETSWVRNRWQDLHSQHAAVSLRPSSPLSRPQSAKVHNAGSHIPNLLGSPGLRGPFPSTKCLDSAPESFDSEALCLKPERVAGPRPSLIEASAANSCDAAAKRVVGLRRSSPEASEDHAFEATAKRIFDIVDADGSGSVSKLEFIAAVFKRRDVGAFVARAMDGCFTNLQAGGDISMDEQSFDAVDDMFHNMAAGKQRVKFAEFEAFFRNVIKLRKGTLSRKVQTKSVFDEIDSDGNGAVSKLELVAAVQKNKRVAEYLLPGLDMRRVLQDERIYDAVSELFDSISGGKQRFSLDDFELYYTRRKSFATDLRSLGATVGCLTHRDRSQVRVLVIGPGFGRQQHPRQGATLVQAGFQVNWCMDLPERPDAIAGSHSGAYRAVAPYLGRIRQEIQDVQPDVLLCASQGGAYVIGLWQVSYWRGPTVMINAHPSLPRRLPEGIPLVLAHGSNDKVYPRSRDELEAFMASASPNKCFLYWTANSGQVSSGSYTRLGDGHIMESLLTHNCLPRLIDAAISDTGPEVQLLKSWREELGQLRCEAESWLGHTPEHLRRFWTSPGRTGCEHQKLFIVPRESEEFSRVATIFKAAPASPAAYMLSSQGAWERTPIIRIERVENGQQLEGCVEPYRDAVRRSLAEQHIQFEPSIHTCWAFHGAGSEAIESIVNSPEGFQPLTSGARNSSVWGSGTYLARDAKYVADGQFCIPRRDGSRSTLLCLMTIGMPCLGSPLHKGVLPFRQKPHRYNSSVDSLSSPEIYVAQHPGSVQAAYVITF